jgi:diguanylate cyclase (GGDEF)-like protein/PAS domain S-box-containing protein
MIVTSSKNTDAISTHPQELLLLEIAKLKQELAESQSHSKLNEERYSALLENMPLGAQEEDYSPIKKETDRLISEGIEDFVAYFTRNPEVLLEFICQIKITSVNQALLDLYEADSILEYLENEIDVMSWWSDSWVEYYAAEIATFVEGKSFFQIERSDTRVDGSPFISRSIAYLSGGYEDTWERVITVHEDITLRKQMEEDLRQANLELGSRVETRTKELLESEQHFSALIDSAPICIHQINREGNFISMNPAGLAMMNTKDEAAIIGLPYIGGSCVEDRERISLLLREALQGQFCEFEFTSADGKAFSSNFVPIYNADGEVQRLLGLTQDITERKQAEEKLSYQASYDALTGLVNRQHFERRAETLISNRLESGTEHAICFMDLDQFKVVNDTCGHIAGDELLRRLADALQKIVRRSDILARLGGDEFAVLMEHCSLQQAQRAAEALRKQVENLQFVWEGQSFRIGVSIGLVAITDTTGDLTELLMQADAACYMAKELGRNRIHVYHPDDSELAQRQGEMQWVPRIARALDEDRFTLYAQPIVPLHDNVNRHYELLLRMVDDDGKIIPPGAYLPAAERYDLINKLDTWVVGNAFAFMSAQAGFMKNIHFVSINLSGQSITNINFLNTVVAKLEEFDIDPVQICFEITETAAISNLVAATKFISSLKALGCRFALDDFGSGLSSFGYLKSLPVDYLKIDGQFVKDIVANPIDYEMVKSINDIGHVMGMQTIAEFVENDEIKEQLITIGVDFAQGYGIGKPEPLEKLI